MPTKLPHLTLALAVLLFVPAAEAASTPARRAHQVTAASAGDVHVRALSNGRLVCRDVTPEERQVLDRSTTAVPLHVISPLRTLSARATGLTLTLRATAQLEANPEAKAAFLRAADIWMSEIGTPVTVIIDVDFGTTSFGTPFDENVIGSTRSQGLGADDLYADLAAALQAHRPATPAFPASQLPTDLGSTQAGYGPSALLRAIGFIDPVADPVKEADYGNPPRIGFNSAIRFDFNPDDGISPGRFDFVSTAVHEIGHVLGFSSYAGFTEYDSTASLSFSVWDLFRFRPGVTAQTFASANRILSSGGEQAFFEGATSLALSTGRPDGTGGDEFQSSHWKADELSGTYIGVMDPSIAPGEKDEITPNDLLALEVMGWTIGSGTPTPYSWILPSSARAPGAGGAFYATSISIGNRGSAEARYTLKFLGNNADGTAGQESSEFVLGSNQSVTYEDVLGSVFGLAPPTYGAIRLSANVASLNVLGQTSTPDPGRPGGTFGQSVPAFAAADLITSGTLRSIVGIRQDSSFRTNLILTNAGTSQVTITGTLLSSSGIVLGTKTWTLPPLGMIQDGPIAPSMGASGAVRDAQLLLTTSTTGGSFAAYAAVIDNVTNDPRTLLPR
jgi:hypothetical protein